MGKMKQFASWFTHGVVGGSVLRKAIFEAKHGDEVMAAVDRFFATRLEDRLGAEPEPEPAFADAGDS